MSKKRDQILRERDRLAPLMERAFALSEADLRAMEEAAAKGRHEVAREKFFKRIDTTGLANPLQPVTEFDREYPHYHVLRVLRDPEYFPLTCQMLYGLTIEPFQHALLKVLWHKPMPLIVGARGVGKTFVSALYCHLRLLFCQGCQVAIVGSAFRQSKFVFDYMEQIWTRAPILRDLVGSGGGRGRGGRENGPKREVDRCDFILGDSKASALPIGPDGSKIRGERANYVLGEEFASVNEEVFNNVVFGFASVSGDPVRSAREYKKQRAYKALGLWQPEDERAAKKAARSNQVVVSGTADYAFGHFAKTYQLYRSIIYSKGDPERVAKLFPEGPPPGFDHNDYACVRLPVSLLPPRYMDEKIVGAARVKLTKSQFLREYDSTFPQDSDGFFRRSVLEACTVGKPASPVKIGDDEVLFYPAMRGEHGVYHVIAIDPASERDKLAIVVVAMCGTHRRIVHCWTTDRKDHQARKEMRAHVEGDYYRFAAKKIRSLMERFPAARLVLDMGSGGGGYAIEEALANPAEGEGEPIWPVMDPPGTSNRKPSDHKEGLHVLEKVQFSNAQWVSDSNHSLKADFEQRKLLFPLWDSASEELALESDKRSGRVLIEGNREVQLEDTLLDVVNDIEELKDELTTIVVTKLASGRERWDVPEVKLEGNKKGRLRKDRYSALLMANKVARDLMATEPDPERPAVGGVKGRRVPTGRPGELYARKPLWVKEMPDFGAVRRGETRTRAAHTTDDSARTRRRH